MRYIVTGATGFLGSHLVRELLARGHQVAVLVRPRTEPSRIADLLSSLQVIPSHLESPDGVAIRAFRPEVAVHLAWQGVSKAGRNDPSTFASNVCGSATFATAVADAGCGVFVGVGSQAECGSTSDVLNEESPIHPDTLYGASKTAARLLLEQLCSARDLRFVWLRILSVYGPLDDPQNMIPYLIRTLLEGGRPALSRGEQLWDYLFVSDVVDAIRQAVDTGEAQGTYVLASSAAPRLADVCTCLRDIIDPRLPLGFGEAALRERRDLRGDSTRFRRATGWEPRVSLEEGLRRTVEWHQKTGKAA